MFEPEEFFSLGSYAHRELWEKGEPVWAPLLILEKYLKAQELGQIEVEIPKTVQLERPDQISIGLGTVIEPGVYIQGPCIIGKNCTIRHGAYIRESVICGDGCSIGHSAEIKNSILLDRSFATHFVYVGDSILGNWVNLGAGVKCANMRLDRKEVKVEFDGAKIKTGLKKFGAIVGDRAQIGCNSVLNPGTLVGKESLCHPLVNLKGTIPMQSEIKQNGIKPIGIKILEQIVGK